MAQNNQFGAVNQSASHKSFFVHYGYHTLVAFLIFVGVGGGFGYWYYIHRLSKQQVAQRVYSEALDEYMRGVDGAKDAWANLEQFIDVSYKYHASSAFGPYFLVLKAEALLWQNKLDDAIGVMQQAMQGISLTSPVYFPYKTKLALMLIDSAQVDRREQGLVELKKLTEDAANMVKDESRYALASYYLNNGDKNAAYALFDQIIQDSTQGQTLSPWVMKAKKIMNVAV